MNKFFNSIDNSYSANNYKFKNLINLIPSMDYDLENFAILIEMEARGFKNNKPKIIDGVEYMFYLISCENYSQIDNIISKLIT